jgi:hypothetical protein
MTFRQKITTEWQKIRAGNLLFEMGYGTGIAQVIYKEKYMRLIFCALGIVAAACAGNESKSMSQADWQANMREISASFSTLLRYAFSADSFFDPKNNEIIEAEVKKMATLAERIHQNGKTPKFDKDPVLKYVTRDFSRDMAIANLEWKSGHKLFARSIIRATSNYCISCHTRNDQGQKDTSFMFAELNVNGFDNIDKADYFAAVRQFPKALDAYDRVLTDSTFAEKNQRQWSIGMKKSLAIAVRVNRSPALSLELVSRVFDAKSVPLSLREAALTWRVAIKEWRDSEKEKNDGIKKVRQLIAQGQRAVANTWNNDAGLVYYLRASTMLHDMLRQQKGLKDFSEALYLSGLAAEGLKEINLWTFDEIYYESCIRYKPHSDNAKKCFARLEALEIFSPRMYSEDEVMKLKELRELAL